MSIRVQDPLFLLSAQTGLSVGELSVEAAAANPDVNKPQEGLKTGEPIPILFARFRNSAGGVMVQPKVTEGSFANPIVEEEVDTGSSTSINISQVFKIKYLFVVSEGELPSMQIRDIFFGACRVGTFNQKYNARAGTWNPGNAIDAHFDNIVEKDASGLYSFNYNSLTNGQSARIGSFIYYRDSDGTLHTNVPYVENSFPTFCGTSGSYSGLTTLSFEYDLPTSTQATLERSLSIFVRNGLQVTRLVDSVTGESDNYVDLVKYLFQTSNRLADDLIDDAALTTAAKFADANGFLFNGALTKSQNLLDWLQATSVNFLLRVSNSGGKFGLLPRLPYNTDHTIKTTQITPEFMFTEEHVVNGGFELEYISLEDREPVCFVVHWRQQPEADFGLVRTVQVRYTGEAANGPFISIDMSNYCTSEDHAVKVGTFRLAQRKFITHHLRLTVRERSYNSFLVVGDIVRVRLRRETSEGEVEHHDKLYEINRIEKTFASTIVYDLTHFPVDDQGRSIVAHEVDAASGAGNTINVGRSIFSCDENDPDATTNVGGSFGGSGTTPPVNDTEVDLDTPVEQDSLYPGGTDNPVDPIGDDSLDDETQLDFSGTGTGGTTGTAPMAGLDTAEVPNDALGCTDGRVCFYRVDKSTGVRTLKQCVTKPISGPYTSTITTDDIDHFIQAVGQCPDPSADDGFGLEIDFGTTEAVEPNPNAYSFVRWTGTITKRVAADPSQDSTTVQTTDWQSSSSTIGLRGVYQCAFGTPITGTITAIVGPCDAFRNWRSAVWGVRGVSSGGIIVLGGIMNTGCTNGGGADVLLGDQTEGDAIYQIVGKWEFSNDTEAEKTVEQVWDGDRRDETVPSNAVAFGSFACS